MASSRDIKNTFPVGFLEAPGYTSLETIFPPLSISGRWGKCGLAQFPQEHRVATTLEAGRIKLAARCVVSSQGLSEGLHQVFWFSGFVDICMLDASSANNSLSNGFSGTLLPSGLKAGTSHLRCLLHSLNQPCFPNTYQRRP